MSKNPNMLVDKSSNSLVRLKSKVYDVISNQRSSLMGQILTIVDASARDDEQRKAIKDLVRDAFWANPTPPEHYDIDEIFGQYSCKFEGKPIEKIKGYDNESTVAVNWFPDRD